MCPPEEPTVQLSPVTSVVSISLMILMMENWPVLLNQTMNELRDYSHTLASIPPMPTLDLVP